jgi:hypothetical protein
MDTATSGLTALLLTVVPVFECLVECFVEWFVTGCFEVAFDGLAWVCPIAAANIPLTSRIISDSLFIAPPLSTGCQIWSVAVSRL